MELSSCRRQHRVGDTTGAHRVTTGNGRLGLPAPSTRREGRGQTREDRDGHTVGADGRPGRPEWAQSNGCGQREPDSEIPQSDEARRCPDAFFQTDRLDGPPGRLLARRCGRRVGRVTLLATAHSVYTRTHSHMHTRTHTRTHTRPHMWQHLLRTGAAQRGDSRPRRFGRAPCASHEDGPDDSVPTII